MILNALYPMIKKWGKSFIEEDFFGALLTDRDVRG